jgi:pilus assembly protein CpaC
MLLVLLAGPAWAQDPPPAATPAAIAGTDGKDVQEKEIEVAVGIDEIAKTDFDFNTKVSIGNESLLQIVLAPQKRELTFKGLKPGRTSVTVRDNVGDVRLRYIVVVTATGKSNTVAELRELIGDVEGLEIGIRGGKVYVGGEIVVPSDITRVNTVLEGYPEVLRIVELSPQTQRVIARKMMDELSRNGLKDVSVRVVNRVFWLEGVVSSDAKKKLAVEIASAYLPDRIALDNKGLQTVNRKDIIDFISVNEKKEPTPPPKQVKITAQFVELAKDYSRMFAFKWAPLMSEDNSSITVGQTVNASGDETGNVSTSTSNALTATISNLFPKLLSARNAGYARIVQSGMVITKDQQAANISKQQKIPFAVGSGDFTRASEASVGFNMQVTPKVLEQEKVELAIGLNVSANVNPSAAIPTTMTNSISTNVVIKSKESAAIGGIVSNTATTAYDKDDPAPPQTAGSLPLFRIIRSKNNQIARSQYVMFLTPEIIDSATAGTAEIRKKFRQRTR